jgi:hypothetical protein
MRIRLALTLDVRRDQEPCEHHDETALGAMTEQAHEHTGPSIGFRIPDAEPEWADRQAGK